MFRFSKLLQEQYKIAIIKQPIIKERKNDNDNFHTFCNTVSKKHITQFIKKTELLYRRVDTIFG
jgi:hypothetical protein